MEGQGGVDLASRSVSVRPPPLSSQLWLLIGITRWKTQVKVVIKRVLLRGRSMGPGVGSSGQACGLEESVALEVSEKLESVGMKELEEWEAVAELGTDVGTGGPSPGDE